MLDTMFAPISILPPEVIVDEPSIEQLATALADLSTEELKAINVLVGILEIAPSAIFPEYEGNQSPALFVWEALDTLSQEFHFRV